MIRVASVLRALAVGALVASLVVGVVTTVVSGPLVVGDVVLRAGSQTPALALAGLVLAGTARLLRTGRPRPGRAPGRRAVVVGLVTAAVLTSGVVWFRDLGTTYTLLAPASPGGCRVVVGETSFLMAGSGTVHVLPPWSVVASQVSRFMADDGIEPVAQGNVELTWDGDDGLLRLWGRPGDPVDPGLHEVDC